MRAVFLLSVLAITAPARLERPAKPDEPKSPHEQIIGDWQVVKLASGTPRVEYPINVTMVLRITPTETTFLVNGQPSEADGLTAKYTVDWSTNPVTVTFMPKQRGGKMPGIIQLDGDTLILGLTTSGDMRPADLASAQLLAHYKRVGK
jgi:uncharacterized protein (TIGR03067 family)